MFGKPSKMSANERFVMKMGREVGNLKDAKPFKPERGDKKMSRNDTNAPDPYKPRTLKVGKNSGFDTE